MSLTCPRLVWAPTLFFPQNKELAVRLQGATGLSKKPTAAQCEPISWRAGRRTKTSPLLGWRDSTVSAVCHHTQVTHLWQERSFYNKSQVRSPWLGAHLDIHHCSCQPWNIPALFYDAFACFFDICRTPAQTRFFPLTTAQTLSLGHECFPGYLIIFTPVPALLQVHHKVQGLQWFSFNFHRTSMRAELKWYSFLRWGAWGSENLSNFLKVTWIISQDSHSGHSNFTAWAAYHCASLIFILEPEIT